MTPFNLNLLGRVVLIFAIISFTFQVHSQDLSIESSVLAPVCIDDNSNCTAVINYPFSISNAIEDNLTLTYQLRLEGQMPTDDIFGEITGNFPNFTIEGTYPLGIHSFIISASDGVANNTKTLPFNVANCTAPTITCISGVNMVLGFQPDGCCASALWVTDFLAAPSTSSCGNNITHTIHKSSDINAGDDTPSANQYQPGIIIDCNDNLTEYLKIYAWDDSFNPYSTQPDGTVGGANYSFCEITIYTNLYTCDGYITNPVAAGGITTEENEAIEDVEVDITTSGSNATVLTDNNGAYEYMLYAEGLTVNISPSLNTTPLNGVSIFDMVLISKHILGIQSLDSPYKIIAADVNNSGNVTMLDLIQIQQLILNQISEFPNNTSWRFIDANYVFPNWQNPWEEALPETVQYTGDFDEVNHNFIGVKIGDVNGSAITN